MKVLRAVVSLLIGFAVSYFLAVTFFNYSDYSSPIDRLFLTFVPALAIGILLFEVFPVFFQWIVRVRARYSFAHHFFGFLLSLVFTYGAVGFLSNVLRSSFSMVIFTAVFIAVGSVFGYYLVRHAVHSFRDGFLSKPLNLILVLALPVILCVVIYASLQFPVMFVWEYQCPAELDGPGGGAGEAAGDDGIEGRCAEDFGGHPDDVSAGEDDDEDKCQEEEDEEAAFAIDIEADVGEAEPTAASAAPAG